MRAPEAVIAAGRTANCIVIGLKKVFRHLEGLTPRDLEVFIGPSGRVSEVLNRKRPLSLRMVKRLHDGLNIPYESLFSKVT